MVFGCWFLVCCGFLGFAYMHTAVLMILTDFKHMGTKMLVFVVLIIEEFDVV